MGIQIIQDSFSQDAVLTTNYADDYLVRGYGAEIHRRIPIAVGTQYFVLDFSLCTSDVIFTLPLNGYCSANQIYVDTYLIDSYTGGTEIPHAKPNQVLDITSQAVFKTGITPTGTGGDELRQYIFGTQGQGNVRGGGTGSSAAPKIWNVGDLLVFKIESDYVLDFEFNLVWYEI
jgi:hypothetical protein